jgi:hypothetical protein
MLNQDPSIQNPGFSLFDINDINVINSSRKTSASTTAG